MTLGRQAFARIGWAATLVAAAALIALRLHGSDIAAATATARAFVALHPAFAAAAFSLVYIAVAALAVPIVSAMTIAAGALFGPWLAVAPAAVGATITMIIARHASRDWVELRFPQLKGRFGGGRSEAAALLFAARVTPVLPFALVNVAAAMSRMPPLTFALVSAASTLPLAVIYVSTGATIGAAQNPADILLPRLVALLALAGAAPLIGRAWVARRARRRRVDAIFGPH